MRDSDQNAKTLFHWWCSRWSMRRLLELDRALVERVVGDAEAALYCVQRAEGGWVAALRPHSCPITFAPNCFFFCFVSFSYSHCSTYFSIYIYSKSLVMLEGDTVNVRVYVGFCNLQFARLMLSHLYFCFSSIFAPFLCACEVRIVSEFMYIFFLLCSFVRDYPVVARVDVCKFKDSDSCSWW